MPYATMTPRARLAHKLRDGKYRARRMGCDYELVTIAQAVSAGLLAETVCYYCKMELGDLAAPVTYTLEHKIPLKLDGPHTLENICKACPECNQSKAIQTELEYMARLDRLITGGSTT